jgi:dTDP-glucose 4,6-dehydratase
MANILVTGGLGFIGSNWILNNLNGNFIVNIDANRDGSDLRNLQSIENNDNYELLVRDICAVTHEKIKARFTPDYIVHFAAESHVDRSITDPLAFVKTNVMGTANMLEIARHFGCRFLHVSTDEVFGHLGIDDEPFDETTPYAPRSPYSASKASSDHLVRAYHETYGLDVVITNCCNNYGPRQFPEKLIPVIIKKALNEEPIPVYGDGMNIREWIYVEDHNDAITKVLFSGKSGETYCIGSDVEMNNITLVKLICERLDHNLSRAEGKYEDLITFVGDRPGHDMRYAIDSTKVRNTMDWLPSNEFSEGIDKTIQWYIKEFTK